MLRHWAIHTRIYSVKGFRFDPPLNRVSGPFLRRTYAESFARQVSGGLALIGIHAESEVFRRDTGALDARRSRSPR